MDDANTAILGATVTEVTLVDKIERKQVGKFTSQSLPGHLIHVCTSGVVEQSVGGIRQCFEARNAIWYYENEPIEGNVLEAPWVFYTVSFRAPTLAPPPLNQRVRQVDSTIVKNFDNLFKKWLSKTDSPAKRQLQVHSILCGLISDLLPEESNLHRIDGPTQLWWQIEAQLRERLDEPIDLNFLQQLSGQSQRSISRACRLATNLSPMKRVKKIRLDYARGLAQLSDLSMTEIAISVGYSRVQEFSRDYRSAFGCTPTQDRQAGPDYRRRV